MKRLLFSFLLLSITLLSSCRRESLPGPEILPPDATGRVPLVFRADSPSFPATVETRAGVDEVTIEGFTSFYATATTGSDGSESLVWSNTEFTGNTSINYSGGKYWPATNPNYHFYAANCPMDFAPSGITVQPTGDKDVVCAYFKTPGYQVVNSLAFRHIYARVGEMVVNADDGYTLSNVSIRLTPNTGGTYDIRTGDAKADGTGWSNLVAGASVELANPDGGTKANDIYLVPGYYTLTASWTATRGEYVETFTNKTASVEILGGRVNNLKTYLGGRAVQLQFKVSVFKWGTGTVSPTFPLS